MRTQAASVGMGLHRWACGNTDSGRTRPLRTERREILAVHRCSQAKKTERQIKSHLEGLARSVGKIMADGVHQSSRTPASLTRRRGAAQILGPCKSVTSCKKEPEQRQLRLFPFCNTARSIVVAQTTQEQPSKQRRN